jgi:hypothetical protein
MEQNIEVDHFDEEWDSELSIDGDFDAFGFEAPENPPAVLGDGYGTGPPTVTGQPVRHSFHSCSICDAWKLDLSADTASKTVGMLSYDPVFSKEPSETCLFLRLCGYHGVTLSQKTPLFMSIATLPCNNSFSLGTKVTFKFGTDGPSASEYLFRGYIHESISPLPLCNTVFV